MPFTCPSCERATAKLVIYTEPRKLGCPNCGTPKLSHKSVGLSDTVQNYVKYDGTMGKISRGKAWEIMNRRTSRDDNKTIINKVTGKETQY